MSPVPVADALLETGEVLQRRRNGGYHSLTVVSPQIARRAQPGQFIMVAVDPSSRCILQRPFSIAQAHSTGPQAGAVEIVFDAIGTGTEWLAARRQHDRLSLAGPLGRAFVPPDDPATCLLVGGGYGAAPLFYLAEELRRRNCRIDVILGAATEERILGALEAKRLSRTVTFTTEDGSLGEQGRVTDVLAAVAARSGTELIYACGPMPMLEAVSQAAGDLGIPCQVAVEEFMACGIGVCWTCVVPVRTQRGVVMARSCTEGPVFDGAKVAWG